MVSVRSLCVTVASAFLMASLSVQAGAWMHPEQEVIASIVAANSR